MAELTSTIAALREAVKALEEALEEAEKVIEPFAEAAPSTEMEDDDIGVHTTAFGADKMEGLLNVGHFRAATAWRNKYGSGA